MYLQQVIYQMQGRIESLLLYFHLSERRNLALMTVGMVYAKSECRPQIAASVVGETQTEALVQRFERLLKCPKLIPLEVLRAGRPGGFAGAQCRPEARRFKNQVEK